VLTVYEYQKDEPKSHNLLLQHGRITHGLQFVDVEEAMQPTTYYNEASGVGLAVRRAAGRRPKNRPGRARHRDPDGLRPARETRCVFNEINRKSNGWPTHGSPF